MCVCLYVCVYVFSGIVCYNMFQRGSIVEDIYLLYGVVYHYY